MFRRVVDRTRRALGMSIRYPDPVFIDPRERQKKRAHGGNSNIKLRSGGLGRKAPSCVPGTIAFHDKMTRHFGHKVAEDFRHHYIKSKRTPGMDLVVPTAEDFANNPPWEHLRD